MKNAELIKALRYCTDNEKQDGCDECPYLHNWMCHTMLSDAAAALEADDKRIKELEAQIPKEGEWIDEQRGRWIYAKCNLCGKVQDVRSNYCPNCGARMNHKYCDVVNGCVMCDVELCNGKENRNERNETETVSVLRRIRAH